MECLNIWRLRLPLRTQPVFVAISHQNQPAWEQVRDQRHGYWGRQGAYDGYQNQRLPLGILIPTQVASRGRKRGRAVHEEGIHLRRSDVRRRITTEAANHPKVGARSI